MKRPKSYSHAIFNNEKFDPGRAALIYQLNPVNAGKRKEVTLTYGALAGNSARLASFLKSTGLKKGDCAVVFVPLGAELYEILFGLNRLGMVAVFFDAWSSPENIAEACRRIKPKVFFGIPKAHWLRLAIKPMADIPIQVIVSPHALIPKFSLSGQRYHQIIEHAEAKEVMTPLKDNDPQLIVFTTGSSGRPKGCIRDQHLALSSIKALNDGILFREDGSVEMVPWPGMILASFYHLRTVVVPAFEQGNIRQCDYKHTLQLLGTHGVSSIIAPPVFFENLIRATNDEHRPILNQIKLALTGGASVTENILERMQAQFPYGKAVAIYGCTEAEPISTISARGYRSAENRSSLKTGISVGAVHQALECRIIRDTEDQLFEKDLLDNHFPLKEIGEVIVKGPQVSTGYFKDKQALSENKIIEKNGDVWHRTGDLGYFDENDILWITGRRHSVVRTNTRTFYPDSVEPAFQPIRGVERAGLVGYSDRETGKQIAVVVLNVTKSFDARKIIRQAEKLNRQNGFFIDRILLCRYLPVDPRHNTKIDYPVLSNAVRNHFEKDSSAPFVHIKKTSACSSSAKRLGTYLAMFLRTRISDHKQSWGYEEGPSKGPGLRSAGGR